MICVAAMHPFYTLHQLDQATYVQNDDVIHLMVPCRFILCIIKAVTEMVIKFSLYVSLDKCMCQYYVYLQNAQIQISRLS